ncbi:VOC family protein [Saliterribacillus persicus]|uniref:VOC domain-containing protein n=1 Tax=Saliterribacillus persicus TaxID=930114 RepID=A0A368Y0X9_9BACI|nr:VOC family protein [Saliterribacillus persicus]RCW71904.1 hypothetical protein DFR57_10587 [Saliterribacillus persicus]
MNRINLITLGVKDMKTSLTFYRDSLGFRTYEEENNPAVVFFDNNGTKLALFPLKELEKDIGKPLEESKEAGFPGFTLAYNAKSLEEVDRVMNQAKAAGAEIVKPAQKVFWGGYSGYFKDPNGYYWEVAYGEMWKFDKNDMLIIEDTSAN